MLRKILIVDDSQINREILKKILQDDYGILEAANGAEALRTLKNNFEDISAVMLDIIMPGMSGFEVLEAIGSDEILSQVPIIVATGNAEEDSEVKALSLGAKDYILKPYNPAIIKHRLRNTISLRETAAIANLTKKDSLTGLYSRDAFFAKAAEMISKHQSGYYVMASFDIDNFKVINDQYGAAMGDRVLKGIADIFKEGFASLGGICCRVTADNFAILYPYSCIDSEKLKKIRDAASFPVKSIRPVTFSTGRYIINDPTMSISAMYDRATLAESYVKGRYDINIAQYDESMREDLLKEQLIVNEMQQALKKNQFEVWLQPQYNHSSGALIGAEALVRWRHGESGKLIPPCDFIPVFERNGFIYEMDKYVWERCCILIRKWIDEGARPLPVSVNVSRYDVFREDFYDVITKLVEKYSIPIELFRLEVTESAFAQSANQIIDMVKRLMDYGFTIEIDDFGSGYSSLNTLKDVPAHILKLDMRFFEKNSNSSRGGNIVESVVRMAKWLDMAVIAEGVETKEQADYLKSIGSNYVQGFLYARPMPVMEYEELMYGCAKEQKMAALETVETFDNNDFWNPESMETLIFNSYIGAACIFEYNGKDIEVLRVNDKYAKVLGDNISAEEALKISWTEHICDEDKGVITEAIKRAIKNKEEVTCEAAFDDLAKGLGRSHLKASLRVIASTGNRHLIYSILENITAQREAEQKTRKTTEQLQFLNETAHDLLEQTDFKSGMSKVMDRILNYFGGDRAYVVEIDYENNVTNNSFEICRDGVAQRIDALQDIPLKNSEFLIDLLSGDTFVNGEMVAVPVRLEDKLIGFIGVDNPSRNITNVDKLVAIGDYIGVMLTRRDLLENLPGGAGIYNAYSDGRLEEIYLNKGYFRLIEAAREKRTENLGFNVLNPVHPDDLEILLGEVKAGIAENRTISADFRILTGKGEYKWLNVRGDIASKSAEKSVLFASYSDIDHMKKVQLSLEASRQAMGVAGKTSSIRFWLFDLEKRTITPEFQDVISLPNMNLNRENIPESFLGTGEIHHEDEAEFLKLYKSLDSGAENCEITVRILNEESKKYEWQHIVYTRLDDSVFKSPMAVGFSINADVEQENRLRYEHELKLRKNMIGDSISYYQLNLTGEIIEDFYSKFSDIPNMRQNIKNNDEIQRIILKNVLPEYHEIAADIISPKGLLKAYEQGRTTVKCTYRRKLKGLGVHWVEATATIVEKPHSDEVTALLYVQDIDVEKKDQLAIESIMGEEIDYIAIINAFSGSARFAQIKVDFGGIESHQTFHFNTKIKQMIETQVAEEDVEKCRSFFFVKILKAVLEKEPATGLLFKVKSADGRILKKSTRAFYLDETHQEIILIQRDITDI